MLTEIIKNLLRTKEFVSVATADMNGRPNAAPKFLVKADKSSLYLFDHVIGKTWANIQANPRVSISFFDSEHLTGYQVNGTVTPITCGPEFDAIIKELQSKALSLTIERVIEGVKRGKKSSSHEVTLAEHGVVLKVKVNEVVEINPKGKVMRENVE